MKKKLKDMNYKLVMLNPVTSRDTGWVKYGYEINRNDEKELYYVETTFLMADCSRVISLSFDFNKIRCDGESASKNRRYNKDTLAKVAKLRAAICEFEQMLIAVNEEIEKDAKTADSK